jgi:retron-type reverse transcriptase
MLCIELLAKQCPLLSRPQLYFVKLDVQACFDTITQAKLIQILRDIISEVFQIVSFIMIPSAKFSRRMRI